MNNTIFIPKRINVGFQNRNDTYTGKLAYVIYYDEKGKLRKEPSWQNWRDKSIDPQEFYNEPTSGFVLNKKVGGTCYNWDPRQTYTRVYDPRGFEFEITIPNLLWILENGDCIKGKGLDGEFVYGWDGADLLLVPVDAPEYAASQKLNAVKFENTFIKGKDLIVGHAYKFVDNKEYIFLGRYDRYDYKNYEGTWKTDYEHPINCGKQWFFGIEEPKWKWISNSELENSELEKKIKSFKSLTRKVVADVSGDVSEQYKDYVPLLKSDENFSPIDVSKDTFTAMTMDEILDAIFYKNGHDYHYNCSSAFLLVTSKKDNKQYNICIHYNIKNQPYDIREDNLPPEWKNPDARIYYVTIADKNGHIRPAEYFGDFVKSTYVNTGYTNWWPHNTNYDPRYAYLTDLLKYFTPVWRTRYLANGEFFSKGSY